MRGRQVADVSEIVAFNRVSRERLWDLIEHPLIDHAGLALRARVFERNERLSEKLAHLAVDLSRPEIAVIQKNLEASCGFLIVIRQRDKNFRHRLWSRSGDLSRRHSPDRRRRRP